MTEYWNLSVENAPHYASERLGIPAESIRASELSGGVSSTVILLETDRSSLVLKQSLGQLRVQQEWYCDRRRILQEASALRLLAPRLPDGAVPAVVFEDAENLLYGMTAAPAGAETWKTKLLRGECEPATAIAAGKTLAAIFKAGWQSAELARRFGDLSVFDQLRLQPYFGQCTERYPRVAPQLQLLIDGYPGRCQTLVHGDWSPKNMLVCGPQFTAIDFEVIHFGDPAFDVAFLLNHLLLKAFHRPANCGELAELGNLFWKTLQREFPEATQWSSQVVAYWGGLLLARIDGKSPVEYITEPKLKDQVRAFALQMICSPPSSIAETFQRQCR